LRSLVRGALQARDIDERDAPADDPTAALIGGSPVIVAVREQIRRLARSMAPVAITGESGSGKELAARLIHACSTRAVRPFVAVNCGAIPETLMESEFFGHRRGAFSGADQEREGLFQAAHGGTLFLDEVADLPLNMQVKLLRAIQEKRVRKLGSNAEDPVDVRIISATHQDLARSVAAGRFRQDLYYRLNVIELALPSLRERPDDVAPLGEAILGRLAARAGLREPPRMSSVTLRYLRSYAFPGNVRELENLLERALAYCNGEVINVEDLGLRPSPAELLEPADEFEAHEVVDAGGPGPAERGPSQLPPAAAVGAVSPEAPDDAGVPESLPAFLDQVERDVIQRALALTGNNRTAAARRLGITFRALRHRMQRLGIA
jgi:two-component system response regulator PilR (NtrC family)